MYLSIIGNLKNKTSKTNIMKNFARILTTFILLLIALNFYSQANNNNKTVELENQNLKFKADNILENKTTGIITLFGNAALMSDSINFEGAEKIIFNTQTKKIEILKPKNFKIFHLNYLIKEKSDNYDLMIYDVKENTLTL